MMPDCLKKMIDHFMCLPGYDPRVAIKVRVKFELPDDDDDDDRLSTHPSEKRIQLLSKPEVMEEALSLYREAPLKEGKGKGDHPMSSFDRIIYRVLMTLNFFYGTEEAQVSPWTSPFFTDQVFGSREDMMNWVKNTAYSLGYVIVTQRSKKYKNSLIKKLFFMCDRSGKPGGSKSSRNTSTKKTDCPFKLVGKYSLKDHYWTIRVVCNQHNHPTLHLDGHAYARRLSDDDFCLVEDLTWKSVPPSEILSMLKDQDETNLSTLPTISVAQRNRNYEKTGVLRYVNDNWLDKYKKYFVSASIDQSLNFGNRASNRVESQHAKLKKYIYTRNYTLDKFVRCIDKIAKSQLTTIKESFGESEISCYHKYNIPCFNLLRGFASNEALDLMVKEINRSNNFQLDSSTCGCQLHNSCGLPCACRLSLYITSGECIPLNSVDILWRMLDLLPATSLQSDNTYCDTELNHVKEHFNKQSDGGKRSVFRKLVDIFNPTRFK
ncbi:hypothetical protein OROMI_003329 [Orobanche minor]